jgi:hypothetical protein
MFGISFLVAAIDEHNRREEWIASMPEEERKKIRARDEQAAHEKLIHTRALEIAEIRVTSNETG